MSTLFHDNPIIAAVVTALRVLGCITRSNAAALLSLTTVQLTAREVTAVLAAFPAEVGVTVTRRRSGRVCIVVHETEPATDSGPAQQWIAPVFVRPWVAEHAGRRLQALLRIAALDAPAVDGHPAWCESVPHLLPNDPTCELHIGGDYALDGSQGLSFGLEQSPDRFGGETRIHFVAESIDQAFAGVHLTLEDAEWLAAQLVDVRAPRRLEAVTA